MEKLDFDFESIASLHPAHSKQIMGIGRFWLMRSAKIWAKDTMFSSHPLEALIAKNLSAFLDVCCFAAPPTQFLSADVTPAQVRQQKKRHAALLAIMEGVEREEIVSPLGRTPFMELALGAPTDVGPSVFDPAHFQAVTAQCLESLGLGIDLRRDKDNDGLGIYLGCFSREIAPSFLDYLHTKATPAHWEQWYYDIPITQLDNIRKSTKEFLKTVKIFHQRKMLVDQSPGAPVAAKPKI